MPELVIPIPGDGNPNGATPQGQTMDATLQQFLNTSTLQLQTALIADHNLATARARDTALNTLKVLDAVTAKELLVSDDMGDVLRANAASGAPTTREHSGAVVAKP